MRSLEEQISGKCIHFTGISNEKCEKGIEYDTVRDKTVRPYTLPCLAHEGMNGGECKHCEFPSLEAVQQQVKDIQSRTQDVVEVVAAVKAHYKKTKQRIGKIECAKCGGDLNYAVSDNGHTRATCTGCSMGWIE